MAQNNNILLKREKLKSLIPLLNRDKKFNKNSLNKRKWVQDSIDDKNLFDIEAINLSKAMGDLGVKEFYIANYDEVLVNKSDINAYVFPATKEGVESFQQIEYAYLIFDYIVIFSIPVKFCVIRPGDIDDTYFAGPKKFVETCTNARSIIY